MKKLNLPLISIIAAVLIIAVAGTIIFIGIGNYSDSYDERKAQELRETIISYVAQCYALEGSYPPDLQYLADHYGLQLNTQDYSYHYELFATNIFPDVRVFVKTTGD